MCSVEEPVMIKERLTMKICVKCKTSVGTFNVRQTVYCTPCFQDNIYYKYRGISKHTGSHILIGYDGGHASSTLLHFVQKCRDLEPRNPLLNIYKACFVITQNDEKVEQVKNSCLKYNIPLVFGKIERDLVDKFAAPAKDDVLSKIVQKELIRVAIQEKCTHIYLANTSTTIAVNILSKVCHGAGYSLSSQVAANQKIESVEIVRPLKDCSKKEIACYNYLNNVQIAKTEIKESLSIDKLVTDFVLGLEDEYPSTVSIVARIGKKLIENQSDMKCSFCGLYVQDGVDEYRQKVTVKGNLSFETGLCYSCQTNHSEISFI